MLIFQYILAFLGGLFVGSFLNVVSDRMLQGKSFIKGRSKCSHCQHELTPKDLIPVISFATLRGKCRYCKGKLAWYYPFSELLTGSLFVLMAYYSNVFTNFGFETHIQFVYLSVIMSLYVVIILTDLKEKIIPDNVVYFGVLIAFLFGIFTALYSGYTYYNQLMAIDLGKYLIQAGFLTEKITSLALMLFRTYISTALIFLFFYSLILLTKGRGMGGGDLKLSLMIGLFNAFPLNIAAIFMGFVFGAVISLLLVFLRIKSLKDTVPFGPFMVAGSIFVMFYGQAILQLYSISP
jgi:prepilin signal peptidase PulO-like enzyme (type II secretory pathway)